jgi:hypothetical protein
MTAVAGSNINHVGPAVAHAPRGHTAGPDGHRRVVSRTGSQRARARVRSSTAYSTGLVK